MSAELRISDRCPHCGQQVLLALAAVPPVDDERVGVTVIVDPRAARLRAAEQLPTDHPCPGPAPGSENHSA